MIEAIAQVLNALQELLEDTGLPKNARQKIERIMRELSKGKSNMEISKAIQELEEIGEDMNLQSYTRTQLFNLVSLLESV